MKVIKNYFSIAQVNNTWCVTVRRGSQVRIYAECHLGMNEASSIAETARRDAVRGHSFDFYALPKLVQSVSRTGKPCFRVYV